MPGPNTVLDKGYYIDAASNKHKCQKRAATVQHATEAGANEHVLGVLQETVSSQDATDGRVADVRVMGIATCIASAAISIGARLVAAASGKVVTAGSGAKQNQVGIAETAAAADGDHIQVTLTPGVQIDVT